MVKSLVSLFAAIIGLAVVPCPGAESDLTPPDKQSTERHALLIGCTQYPYVDRLPELYGPANDIPLWRRLLTSASPGGFAFPAQNVAELLGWPTDARRRPTRANITAAFESLIAKAKPGVQFMIVLSGHGTQQPIPDDQDPFEPKDPEPDGLDEVFLPADAKEGSPVIENGIRDDEIGAWLDRMRVKGAAVWIVFDCCHSGTMTRGDDLVERSRHVEPTVLGIRQDKLDQAALRAESLAKERQQQGLLGRVSPEKIPLSTSAPSNPEMGSLVAFYAAQPFERAPELPLPEGKPQVKENFFGLLSYTLVQTLMERRSPLSYRELSRLLASSYRARRGTRWPTPFAEGDLDREVLSVRQWPLRSELILEQKEDELQLGAGELHGITLSSILAVHPPINDTRDAKTVLGYVKVTSVLPTASVVVPCSFNGMATLAEVPTLSRCTIASRNFGEMKVKLFASSHSVLEAALKRLDKQASEQLMIVARDTEAQWSLKYVTPAEAVHFGITDAKSDRVLLVAGEGVKFVSNSRSPQQRCFGTYSADDEQALTAELERDLPKVFRWQNLWRVSGGVNALNGGESHGLEFQTHKLRRKDDPKGEELRNGVLKSGDFVKFTLRNDGQDDLWITLLYLDANMGIKNYGPYQIRIGAQLKPLVFKMKADGDSAGQEGLIVFATPIRDKSIPDYAFLEQEPLRVAEERFKGLNEIPPTPFGQLLKAAAFNRGTRGMEPVVSSTPAILTQTWLLVP